MINPRDISVGSTGKVGLPPHVAAAWLDDDTFLDRVLYAATNAACGNSGNCNSQTNTGNCFNENHCAGSNNTGACQNIGKCIYEDQEPPIG